MKVLLNFPLGSNLSKLSNEIFLLIQIAQMFSCDCLPEEQRLSCDCIPDTEVSTDRKVIYFYAWWLIVWGFLLAIFMVFSVYQQYDFGKSLKKNKCQAMVFAKHLIYFYKPRN